MQQFKQVVPSAESIAPEMFMQKFGVGRDQAENMAANVRACDVFVNGQYQVTRSPVFPGRFPGGDMVLMVHLSIIPLGDQQLHSWPDMQAIKNELVGAENFAVEVYPAESRLVDCGPNYHLWVVVDPSLQPTFGWTQRRVQDDSWNPRVEEVW